MSEQTPINLAAEWRERAHAIGRDTGSYRQCADELEKVIAQQPDESWRENERLTLLGLRQALEGFEIRVDRALLQPLATYLDNVTLSCEFQPGIGRELADLIRKYLAMPIRQEGKPVSGKTEVELRRLVASLRVESKCAPTGHTFGEQAAMNRAGRCADEIEKILGPQS